MDKEKDLRVIANFNIQKIIKGYIAQLANIMRAFVYVDEDMVNNE